MAKKSKGKQTAKKDIRRGGVRRQERRFVSQASTSANVVRAFGALAALLLGAGLWGYFYAKSFADDEALRAVPSYLIAAGAVVMGVTIWIGTSSEPPIRVGAPGISAEKGELRRMPWWAVEKITFESGTLALVVAGKDESGSDWTFKVPVKPHPEAVAWIVKEALDRVPRRVDIEDGLLDAIPEAHAHAGQRVDLEPLQVVGKRCAVTGKTISYEPDARVCPRCERVYEKKSVPKKCKCDNSLVHLRPKPLEGIDEVEEVDAGGDDEASDERTSTKTLAADETASS
ncbi:MAG: hypothetical protein KF782_32565 [Labilithrix sp.]|nr:hypothetical protein [Labilithrix sp.]